MKPFITTKRVEFSDTDAAGLLHFTTYFRFMEAVEADFFRTLDIPLLTLSETEFLGFPRVDVQCRFLKPLFFDDLVKVELTVDMIESSRINYAFQFLKEMNSKWIKTAQGKMAVVFAKKSENGNLTSLPIPSEWIERIKHHLNA